MRSLHNQNKTREFVDGLEAGTRVVWIANGSEGTVQPDKSILWDDGFHMTHERMQAGDLLLIHNPKDRKRAAIVSDLESQPVPRVRRGIHGSSPDATSAVPHPETMKALHLRQLRPHPIADAPPPVN